MADVLSQEEIDRLLNATSAEPEDEISDLGPAEVEAVEKLIRVFFASANSALATLLARPASVSEGVGQVVRVADLDNAKGLLLRFPFRSGFSGHLAFLMRHREASVLADLILGGEGGEKEVLDEADLDALKEAMAQVTGSGAPTLSATLGKEVGFGPPEIQEVEPGELALALPWKEAFLGVGSIKVDDALDAGLRILLPVDVAHDMALTFSREEEEPQDAPPAAKTHEAASAPPVPTPSEPSADVHNIDLILDIEVEVMVRLGETVMPLKEIQRLRPGSIINLDKDTEAPVDLVVNDKVIAKGELVVVSSDHFALRITDIETPSERIRRLGP